MSLKMSNNVDVRSDFEPGDNMSKEEKKYEDAIRHGISLVTAKEAEKAIKDALGIGTKDRRRTCEKNGLDIYTYVCADNNVRNVVYVTTDSLKRRLETIKVESA